MNAELGDIFLGIDLGTSSCKVALVDSSGNILAMSVNSYPLSVSGNGRAEQNPEDWWNAVVTGMKEVLKSAGTSKILSIGVTGQWSGTVAVDMNGDPIAPAIVWMDTRGEEIIREISGGFPSISGYRVDKLVRWLRITGGAPAHSGKDSLAHILYMKRFMPEIYERAYKFLEPKDFIVSRLTGKILASWDNAALLWSTDNRDSSHVVYDQRLIRMNSLDAAKLPDLVSPLSVVGKVKEDVSSITDISREARVISGCGDTQCSLIGVGAVEDNDVHIYLGTSSWVTAHVPYKKTDIFHNIASLPSAIPGKYFIAAEQENACNCLEYVSKLLSIEGSDKYDLIDAECRTSPASSNGLLFLPWLFGERAPVENPFLRGGFFNMGLNNTRSDLIRSVMGGVAMNSRWLLGIMEKFMDKKADHVIMAGGGVISTTWSQIYSDVLDRRILVMDNPRYSTVRGAALLSAVGSGFMKITDLRVLREKTMTFDPDPGNTVKYDRLFRQFISYYKNNRSSMREMNSREVRFTPK